MARGGRPLRRAAERWGIADAHGPEEGVSRSRGKTRCGQRRRVESQVNADVLARHAATLGAGADLIRVVEKVDDSEPVVAEDAAARAQSAGLVAAVPCAPAPASHSSFVLRDGLLYRQSRHCARLCIPAAGELRRMVLHELHATPLGSHFGRDKTLSLAQRPECQQLSLNACGPAQRVPPAGLLYPIPVPSRRGGLH